MTIILIIFACLCLCRASTSSLFDEELYRNVLDADLCARQLQHMDASEFYESSFRVPQGLLFGTAMDYGNFHQCLAIKQNFPGGHIQGKYCVIETPVIDHNIVKVPMLGGTSEADNITWTEWNLKSALGTRPAIQLRTLRLGVCVPRACAAAALLRPYAAHPRLRFNYSDQFCRLPGDKPFHAADYVGIVILSLIGLLTVASTTYELRYIFILKRDPATGSELLRAWSVYSNTSRLLTFTNKPRSLDCLDGIRALSLLWVVMIHTVSTSLPRTLNRKEISIVQADKYIWIYTAVYAVDSFFILSGLLLVYSATYKKKQLTLKKLPLFYLNRYMRLFPMLALMVLLQASVMHRLVDSPQDSDYSVEVERCRTYWWSALLHVQNIVNPVNMCLEHTWYLSSDMQLHVLSPLALAWVLRARTPRAAWRVLAAAVLASLAAILAVCFYFNFPQTNTFKARLTGYAGGQYDWLIWHYLGTISRFTPFVVGMLFGYALHIYRTDKLRLPKWAVFLFYTLAALLSSAAVFDRHTSLEAFGKNQLLINLKYSLFPAFWAVSLCWLIFACANGYGGPVNWFLSLKPWQFLTRISYAMYLTSVTIQMLPAGAGVNQYFDMHALWWNFAGDMVWTVALSLVACVVVEAPIATLYRLLLNHARRQKPTDEITNTPAVLININKLKSESVG